MVIKASPEICGKNKYKWSIGPVISTDCTRWKKRKDGTWDNSWREHKFMYNQKGDGHISIWLGKKRRESNLIINWLTLHLNAQREVISLFSIICLIFLTTAPCLFERESETLNFPFLTSQALSSWVLYSEWLNFCWENVLSFIFPLLTLPLLSSKVTS